MTPAIVPPPASRSLATLDRETAAYHAEAEADLFRVLDEATRAGYQRFLSRVFHFEHRVETELVCATGLPTGFIAARIKTRRLGEDLLALGLPIAADARFARQLEPLRIGDALDALGWSYVLQRNTLHHQPLYRALIPRIRTTLQVASRYLTTHARDLYCRWHELGAYLDAIADTPDKLDRVVDVARDAFRRQHRWYAAAESRDAARAARAEAVEDRP